MVYGGFGVGALLLIGLVGAALVGAVLMFNGIVGLRQLVRNAWADVDVYLKRRAELIPNLVTAVKAFASHEQALLESVASARSLAIALDGPTSEKASAESRLGSEVTNMLVLRGRYPKQNSSENFSRLQNELANTEKMIANARQYYNACVRDYNTKLEAFPSNMVGAMIGAKQEQFFELETAEERIAPGVG